MPLYQEKFPAGTSVRIASLDTLLAFRRDWKYHHPLQESQLRFAGMVAKVKAASFYHGGDVLYTLDGVEGIWHEELLGPN